MEHRLTDDEFKTLLKRFHKDVDINVDNLEQKILEPPKLYVKYRKLYFDQRRVLVQIDNDIKKARKKADHYYMFDYDYKLSTKGDREVQIDGDDKMIELFTEYERQKDIVEFIKGALKEISDLGYKIHAYIDYMKLKNGIIN